MRISFRWIGAACMACSVVFLACGGAAPAEAKSPAANAKHGKKNKKPNKKADIEASDYAQSCKAASDCVAIYAGDGCQACRCATDAIRKDELPRYKKDLKKFDSCHDPSKCGGDCIAVTGNAAECTNGKCTYTDPI